MRTPAVVTAPPVPDQPSTVLRDRAEAEGYVASVCFKHGPPGLLGVELEWTVHHGSDPRRALDADLLRRAEGQHAPQTINPHHDQLPLPAGSLITVEPGGQVEISTPRPDLPPSSFTSPPPIPPLSATCLTAASSCSAPAAPTAPPAEPPVAGSPIRSHAVRVRPDRPRRLADDVQYRVDAGLRRCRGGRPVRHPVASGPCLAPALVALFANSPNPEGQATGWASSRLRATMGACPPFTLPAPAQR